MHVCPDRSWTVALYRARCQTVAITCGGSGSLSVCSLTQLSVFMTESVFVLVYSVLKTQVNVNFYIPICFHLCGSPLFSTSGLSREAQVSQKTNVHYRVHKWAGWVSGGYIYSYNLANLLFKAAFLCATLRSLSLTTCTLEVSLKYDGSPPLVEETKDKVAGWGQLQGRWWVMILLA